MSHLQQPIAKRITTIALALDEAGNRMQATAQECSHGWAWARA